MDRWTEECAKQRGEVLGRRVLVVDTPGWEWYYSANGTPAWVTHETARSVSLCPPGPHAFLLVLRSRTSVTDDFVRQAECHLAMLGADSSAWHRTMLVVTRGDEQGPIDVSGIETSPRAEREAFRELLQRCGGRCHVMENRRRISSPGGANGGGGEDRQQVAELLLKLEEMVAAAGGGHLEAGTLPLLRGLEAEGRRRGRERRKKQRQMESQALRSCIRAALSSEWATRP